MLNGEDSEWTNVGSGVPQGSVLGTLLFNIFIDDINRGVINNILKFADDTKLFGRVNTMEEIASMQEDINKLQQWANTWKMSFNTKKCKVMHTGKENKQAI